MLNDVHRDIETNNIEQHILSPTVSPLSINDLSTVTNNNSIP
jgi:hypothetical protein